ncbi:MAG TPA: hypothetical protein VGD71_12080 [Kribbella sp.]|jgi:hypothetical protein
MRKLIVHNIVSLDGYITGPNNSVMLLPMGGFFDAYCAERRPRRRYACLRRG